MIGGGSAGSFGRTVATAAGCIAMCATLVLAADQVWAATEDRLSGLLACRPVATEAERLACFDRESARLTEPRFSGRHHAVTDSFTLDRPHRLRFQSDGAIFVLYLRDAKGAVLQNLHIGGGGEDVYLIEKPGTYSLQINGSEGWRIWLDPHDEPGPPPASL